MKTDTELEALLRATLATHASDVREPAPVPTVRDVHRPARRWLPALAAAAVIAAVAATVIGVRAARHDSPASPSPTQSPTRSASPAPTQSPNLVTACNTPLPALWQSAITQGSSRFGANSAFPIAISPNGRQLLVARDFGNSRDVMLVGASGTPHSIYTVMQPNLNQVQHASIDGNYAVIDLQRLPRNANGVLGTVLEVVLIDLRNLHSTLLDSVQDSDITHGRRTIDGSVITDGHVYWDVHNSYANQRGVIRDYDVVTGQVRDAYSGAVGPPSLIPLGISTAWNGQGQIVFPREVPAPVAQALTTDAGKLSLISDGSSYAWVSGRHIDWWAPGPGLVTQIALPSKVVPGLIAVAGNFVMYDNGNSLSPIPVINVLDARTGASAATINRIQPYALSNAGVLVGYRFVGDFKTSPTEPVRIDTTKLPGLHC